MVDIVAGAGLGLFNTLSVGQGRADSGVQNNGEAVAVNVTTGNLVIQHQDELVKSAGVDLRVLRTYNSQGSFADDKFLFNFNQRIDRFVLGLYAVRVNGDGSENTFTYDASRDLYVCTDGDGAHDTLRCNGPTWTYTEGSSGLTETYDSALHLGKMTSQLNSEGQGITCIDYDLLNRVTTLTDSSGQTITEQRDLFGNVCSLRTCSNGVAQSTVSYKYESYNDELGVLHTRLQSVSIDLTPGDGSIADGKVFTTTYAYVDFPDGLRSTSLVKSITQSDGSTISFAYEGCASSSRVTKITVGSGAGAQVTEYAYGNGSTDVKQLLATGAYAVTTVNYDCNQRVTSVVTPPDANGQRLTTRYTYDADGNMTKMVDARGNASFYQYDARGNLTLEQDAQGGTTQYLYDAHNLRTNKLSFTARDATPGNGINDASGALVTRYVYDSAQRLRFVVQADGSVKETRYTDNGCGTAATRTVTDIAYLEDVYPLAALVGAGTPLTELNMLNWLATLGSKSASQVARTQLDFRGQVASVTTYAKTNADGSGDASGAATAYSVYDRQGHLLRSVDERGASAADTAYDTVYAYDGMGRMLSVTRSTSATGEQTVTTSYDDVNHKVVTQQANGLLITRSFNSAGLLTQVQESKTANGVNEALSTTTKVYDNTGLLRATIDPVGGTQYDFYDELGRAVGTIDGTGALTESIYDGDGHVIKTIAYANFVSAANIAALAAQASSGLFSASTGADALAVIRPAVDGQNDRRTLSRYNGAGLLERTTIGSDVNDAGGVATDYVYDGQGRLTSTIERNGLGDARTTQYFYDVAGRQRGTLDADSFYTEFKYDQAGQVVETIRHANPVSMAQVAANHGNALSLSAMAPALGSQVFAVPEGLAYTAGTRVRLSANGGAVYMEGLITSYGGSAMVLAVDTVMGSGTSASWQVAAAIYPRAEFDLPPSMLPGNKTFTTQIGLPYSVGTVVRLTASDGDWLQGTVTAYSGDQMTVNVTSQNGIGLHTSWDLTASNASTGKAIAPSLGTKVFGVPSGLSLGVNDRVRLSANNGASYMEGLITGCDGDRMTVAVDTAVGNTSAVTWQIATAILPGADFVLAPLITTGSKTFTTQTGLPYPVGSVVRLAANNGATWMQGTVTAYSGDQMSVNVTSKAGAGLYTHWDLGLANVSSVSVTIPTVLPTSKTFTVPAGLNYAVNARVRLMAAGGSAWVEGTVQSYSGTSMSVAIDKASGSGSYTSWVLRGEAVPTSASSVSVGTGLKAFTVAPGLPYGVGSRIRFSADNNATYMEGRVVSYLGTSITVAVDSIAGSGTRSNWQLSSAGSAVNAIAPTMGAQVFAVPAGLAYSAGQRVRFIASGGTAWMEGVLQSYVGGTMTVAVDATFGNGSYASWQLSADVVPTTGTQLTVGMGSKTFATTSGLPYPVGSRVRLSANGGAASMEGVVTSYANACMSVNVDTVVGSGTYTNWQLASERAAIDAVVPATGPRELTVPAGLPYAVGTRVRLAANAGGAWMEGVITAYAGTRMNVAVDAAYGNANNAYWELSVPIASASGDIHTYAVYDRRGNVVASIDADGFVTETQYNTTGTVSAIKKYANSIVQPRSPNAGRLAAQLAAVGGDASRLTLAAILPSANGAADEVSIYTYDALNQLQSQTDALGVVTTYTYNSEGQLLTADVTPAGNNPTTQRKDQRIYDIQGRLIEERFARYADNNDAAGYQSAKETHSYDAAGQRTSTTDAQGHTSYYFYDAEGRLRYSVDNARALVGYTYNSFGGQKAVIAYAQPVAGNGPVTIADINLYLSTPSTSGRKTALHYNSTGQLRYSVDALGYVVEQRYDAIGNLIEKIHYKNPVSDLDTSDFSALDASGAYDVRYVYDASDRLRYVIDAKDYITENRYDGLGQLVDTVRWCFATPPALTAFTMASVSAVLPSATGQLTTYAYDIRGQVIASTLQSNLTVDSNGVRRSTSTVAAQYFVYDGFGRQQYAIDSLGFVTEHRFDAVGNAITDLKYQPALSASDIAAFQTNPSAVLNDAAKPHTVLSLVQRYYDAQGQLILSVDPDGYVTRHALDSDGNVVQSTTYQLALWSSSVASGLDTSSRPAQSVIDAFVAQQTPGANNKAVEQFVYDALNQRQMVIDADRYVTEFVRDARGFVTEEIHYSKPLPATATATNASAIRAALAALEPDNKARIASQQFVYTNAFGERAYTLDASGIVRSAVYDAVGQVVRQQVYPTPYWSTPADSGVVLRTRPSDADLKAFVAAQDALQHTLSGQMFRGQKTSVYNQLGEPLYFVDGEGYVTAYVYDDLGHVSSETKVKQPLAANAPIDENALAAWVAGSVADHTAVTSSSFYRENRLSIAVDGAGDVIQYLYDPQGNVVQETKFTQAFTGVRTQANLEAFVASGAHGEVIATHYAFNAGSQLRFKVDARGYATEYRYDAAGHVVQELNYTSAYGSSDYSLAALEAVYTLAVNAPSYVGTRTFYDADGQVKLVIDAANHADVYAYDIHGKVTAHYRTRAPLSTADQALSADALSAKITANAVSAGQSFARAEYAAYDAAGQVVYEVDGEGYVTAHSYDALGNRILSQRYNAKISFNTLAQVLSAAGVSQPGAAPSEIQLQQWQTMLQNDRAAALGAFVSAQAGNFTVSDRRAYDATHNSRVIVDGLGHVTREVYNALGQLASSTDYGDALVVPAQQLADVNADIVQFIADALAANSAIVAHTTTYGYDTEGRLTSTTDALNNRVELSYDFAGNVVQRSEYDAQTSGAATRTTRHVFDADNRLRYEIDAGNFVRETVYDGLGRITQVTQWANPLGSLASYGESDVTAALGPLHETSDASAQHLDQSERYTFDAAGNMLTKTDALGRIERYSYDFAGKQLSKQIGTSGPVWTFAYDKLGRLTDKISPPVDVSTVAVGSSSTANRTLTTHYVFDAYGNITTEIQDHGQAATARTTVFAYDELDRLTTATQVGAGANGGDVVHAQVYDARGNVVVNRDVDGHYTYKIYDAANQLRFEVNADDYATAYTYDAFGNLATLTRYAGRIGAHTAGQALTVADMAALVQADATHDRSITYTYDALNREIQRSQAAVYTVDGSAPASAVGHLASPTTVTAYNGFDEVIAVSQTVAINGVVSGPALTTTYRYDVRGQKTAEINADHFETRWEYDAAGNVTRVTEYAQAIAGGASDAVPSSQDRATVSTYNAANLLVREVKSGASTLYAYDALDHLQTLTNANSKTITYRYNSLGWLLGITEPRHALSLGGVEATPSTDYSYDAFGNQVQEIRHADTSGVPDQVIRSGYDALDHKIWEKDANGHVVYSTYNNAGVLLKTSETVTLASSPVATATLSRYYALDNRGNQIAMSQSYGSDATATTNWIRYNAFGEIEARGAVTSSNAGGTGNTSSATAYEAFAYDQAGRLLRTNAGDGVVHLYGYDFAGRNVLDVTDNSTNNFNGVGSLAQLGQPAQWSNVVYSSSEYDGQGHVTKKRGIAINDTGAVPVTTNIHDRWGNVVDSRGPRTEHTVCTYDAENRLLTTTQYLSESQAIVTTNAYDPLGNLISVLDGNGHLTRKSYNDAGQLLKEWNALDEATLYAYDGFGRVTSETSLLGVRTNSYDANGNLTHTVRGNEDLTYGYDELGRKTSATGHYYAGGTVETTAYFYNSDDSINKTVAPDGTVTLSTYDAFGNKTAESVTYANLPAIAQTWTFSTDAGKYFHRASAHTEPGVTVSYSYGVGNRLSGEDYGSGNSKTYTYYSNGQQKTIVESGVGTTSYAYDLSGNRSNESHVNASNGTYYQSATSTFDALNRVIDINDARTDKPIHIAYAYDGVGNRITVTDNTSTAVVQSYSYDAANRVLVAKGSLNGSNVVCGNDDHDALSVTYDANGRRSTALFFQEGVWVSEQYSYNGDGLLSQVYRAESSSLPVSASRALYSSQSYDGKGRVTSIENYAVGTQKRSTTTIVFNDAQHTEVTTAVVTSEDTTSKKVVATTVTTTTKDASGKLLSTVRVDSGTTNKTPSDPSKATEDYRDTTTTTYSYRSDGKLSSVTAIVVDNHTADNNTKGTAPNKYLDDDTSTYNYDAFGDLTSVTHSNAKSSANVSYVNNASGQVLTRFEAHGTDYTYFFNGQQIGEHFSPAPPGATAYSSSYAVPTHLVLGQGEDATWSGSMVRARNDIRTVDDGTDWKVALHTEIVNKVSQIVVSLSTYSEKERKSILDQLVSTGITFTTGGAIDRGAFDGFVDGTARFYVKTFGDSFSVSDLNVKADANASLDAFFMQTVVTKLEEKMQGVINGHWPGGVTYYTYVKSFSFSFSVPAPVVVDAGLNTDQFYNPVAPGASASTGTYTVHAGDTLQSITASIYGDSSLWFVLADANGLMGTETLVPGQLLKLPTITAANNSTGAYKPYSPGEATGDVAPKLIFTPPAGSPQAADPCATAAMIAIIILSVIVAVVATVLTAGAASAVLGPAVAAVFGAEAAATTTASVVTGAIAGAIGGFAGSLASQGVLIAFHQQEAIDWSQVGVDALIGGLTGGLGKALSALSKMKEGGSKIFNFAKTAANSLSKLSETRPMLAGGLRQGINLVSGVSQGFVSEGLMLAMDPKREVDWAHIAAFGFAMGAGGAVLGRASRSLPGQRGGGGAHASANALPPSALRPEYVRPHIDACELTAVRVQKLGLLPVEGAQACFVAGTLIHTQEGLKPIERIRVGDMVLSQPELTGEQGYRRVVDQFAFGEKEIIEVMVQTADHRQEMFRVTGNHPFWVEGAGWTRADILEPGQVLQLADKGQVLVASVSESGDTENVYNFEVDGFHTYYVGEMGVWVHNTNCAPLRVGESYNENATTFYKSTNWFGWRYIREEKSTLKPFARLELDNTRPTLRKGGENYVYARSRDDQGVDIAHGYVQSRQLNVRRVATDDLPGDPAANAPGLNIQNWLSSPDRRTSLRSRHDLDNMRPDPQTTFHRSGNANTQIADPATWTLSEQSKSYWAQGETNQGYFGAVDLSTGKVYLYPGLNKEVNMGRINQELQAQPHLTPDQRRAFIAARRKDSAYWTDPAPRTMQTYRNGRFNAFNLRVFEPRGQSSGGGHTALVGEYGLVDKVQSGMLMGFGINKASRDSDFGISSFADRSATMNDKGWNWKRPAETEEYGKANATGEYPDGVHYYHVRGMPRPLQKELVSFLERNFGRVENMSLNSLDDTGNKRYLDQYGVDGGAPDGTYY